MEQLQIPGREAPFFYCDSIDSTNTRLKLLAGQGAAHGTVLAAAEQTGGRGRRGRGFASPRNGLYLSLLLLPPRAPERCATLTPLAALAVRRCLPVETHIKWPNDVLLRGKKLCGILVELQMAGAQPQVIVGIGVNVNTREEDFPPELRKTAGSLLAETGRVSDIRALAGQLVRELDAMYLRWLRDECAFLPEYRAACATLGQDILLLQNGEARPARALDVGEDFSLLVEYPDGRREAVHFGEVSVRNAEI